MWDMFNFYLILAITFYGNSLAQTNLTITNGTQTRCPNVTGMPTVNFSSLAGQWYELAITPNNTITGYKCPTNRSYGLNMEPCYIVQSPPSIISYLNSSFASGQLFILDTDYQTYKS
ncbi:unnamed protein product, partial [Oppiella nova]